LLTFLRDSPNQRKHVLTTLPQRLSKKEIVRTFKERAPHRACLPRTQGGVGARPLRGARVYRVAPPHLSAFCAATLSSFLSVCGVSPPRADDKLKPTRSPLRPERHFVDSFITCRLVIARAIARWLPRCPFCHRFYADPESEHPGTEHHSPAQCRNSDRREPIEGDEPECTQSTKWTSSTKVDGPAQAGIAEGDSEPQSRKDRKDFWDC